MGETIFMKIRKGVKMLFECCVNCNNFTVSDTMCKTNAAKPSIVIEDDGSYGCDHFIPKILLQVKNILKFRKNYKIILFNIRTKRKVSLYLPNHYLYFYEIKVGEIYYLLKQSYFHDIYDDVVYCYALRNKLKNFNLYSPNPNFHTCTKLKMPEYF